METPFTAKTERKVGLGESSSHRERAIEFEAPVKHGWIWYWADMEARSLDATFRSESLPNSQGSKPETTRPNYCLNTSPEKVRVEFRVRGSQFNLEIGRAQLRESCWLLSWMSGRRGTCRENPYWLAHWRVKPTGFIPTHPIWNPYSYWKTLSCRSTKYIITVAKEEGKFSTLQDGTF